MKRIILNNAVSEAAGCMEVLLEVLLEEICRFCLIRNFMNMQVIDKFLIGENKQIFSDAKIKIHIKENVTLSWKIMWSSLKSCRAVRFCS